MERNGHKAWGRKKEGKERTGRSSFAALEFFLFFPFGRITAGTVSDFGTPCSILLADGNFSPNGTEKHGLGLPADQPQLRSDILMR
jgi:hypothetical protein